MYADLAVNDELIESIQEQIKMQTNPAGIPWKIVLPEGANALPMKFSMYSSGDYWTPFQDLQMQGAYLCLVLAFQCSPSLYLVITAVFAL